MNPNEETLQLADRYLSGELDDAARRAFEVRCEADPAFAEAVRAHIQAAYAAGVHAREVKRDRLNALYEAESKGKSVRSFSLRRIALVAAAVVILLVGLALALRQFSSPPTLQALYAQYYEPEPFSGMRAFSAWQQVGDAYTREDFPAAIRLLEALLADSTFDNRPRAHYYLAHSYLRAGDPQQALRVFAQVSPESSFIRQSEWYMALLHLQLDDRKAAIQGLRQVAEQAGHYRQTQATALLKALDP